MASYKTGLTVPRDPSANPRGGKVGAVKFLIVDDHAVVREGLASIVRLAAADAVVLQAGDCASALSMASTNADIAMVLMDLQMPDTAGLSALEAFAAGYPDLPVMVVSGSEATEDVRAALAIGALGYMSKSANASTLVSAIRLVLAGEVYVPPFIVQDIGCTATAMATAPPGFQALTDRQREVLRLVGEDRSNKQIAYALGVTEGTVKAHLTTIFRTLGVATRAQAARLTGPPTR